MITQELLDYIKQQLQQGVSQNQIKDSLIANGWQENDINEAFAVLSKNSIISSQTSTLLLAAPVILRQAWSLYKQRWKIFLGIMIIPMLISIGFYSVWTGIRLLGFKFATQEISLAIILAMVSIVFFIITLISQTWAQIALLYAIKDSQERIGVKEAYSRSWHKILSYWWVSFLTAFITIGGFLLFIVPGIIFTVWFSLAMFVLVAEDLKGMDALLKSREYVKGNWGKIFWRFLFIGIFSFIISIILILFFSFVEIPLAREIGPFTISLFLSPLVMAYSFLLYSNIKAVKGKILFVPTRNQKIAFIIVAIFGGLIIPAILSYLLAIMILNTL